MINKIAKKILISYLQTKYVFLNEIINYSKKLSNKLDQFFKGNFLKNNLMKYHFTINLNEISSNLDEKIQIEVIMLYSDKITQKDYIKGIIKPQFCGGMGEALYKNGKNYIIIYGSTNKEEACYNKKYFKQTFTHELMHFLDKYIDDKYHDEFYYGHPLKGFNDNNGIPYPGMYGEDDNLFEETFAQYYTCLGERKQYIFDLMSSIQDYMEKTNSNFNEIINHIITSLNDKNKFMKLVDEFKNININYSSLAFIYHLSFSKQKNGTKRDAIKILESLYQS